MSKLKYWTLVTLDATGDIKIKELENARSFFADTFVDLPNIHEVSDKDIQQRLVELSRDAAIEQSLLAQRCLLCFISWQIEQACLQLTRQFGDFHGFTSNELLAYVLDDDGRLQPSTSYQSFAREVLQTFEPEKSLLSTWTSRKVKQHKALNKFLLGCGLYLVSDWAILNDTRPQQLTKILGEFHSLTPVEIEQAQKVLEAYHKVYRAERWQQRAKGIRDKCNIPTTQQLQKMAAILEQRNIYRLSPGTVMLKLQNLATKLRQYRIYVRGGLVPTISIGEQLNEKFSLIEQIPSPDTSNLVTDINNEETFLKSYREQMLACLEQALHEVIESRVNKLKKKDTDKATKFLDSLKLFHCQRFTMSAIAKELGLNAQYQVTRLLKLKEFRADVQHKTLENLRKAVIQMAQEYSTPEDIVNLDKQITDAINEQITSLIHQAELEAISMQNNSQLSTFSKVLCKKIRQSFS